MSRSRYRKGADRERQLAKRLREDGWYAIRAAGSHGAADIVALKAGQPARLIQLKAGGKSPLAGFPPREREVLRIEAKQAGATAELCWWADRREPVFVSLDEADHPVLRAA